MLLHMLLDMPHILLDMLHTLMLNDLFVRIRYRFGAAQCGIGFGISIAKDMHIRQH